MDGIPTSFGDADGDDNGMHVPAAPQCTRVLDQNALAGLDSYEEEYIATASNTNISVQATAVCQPSAADASPTAASSNNRGGSMLLPMAQPQTPRKSALASGIKSTTPDSQRKTVSMVKFAEEVTHRLESSAMPFNDAAEQHTAGVGFNPQLAGLSQHKLVAECAPPTGGGLEALNAAQLEAALGRTNSEGDNGGRQERNFYDSDDGEDTGMMAAGAPTRSGTIVCATWRADLPKGEPLGEVPLPRPPPPTRRGTQVIGGTSEEAEGAGAKGAFPAATSPLASGKAGLVASGVGGQEAWKTRLAGLSKERLRAENLALRSEVEALRAALQRRRAELGEVAK